MSSSRTKIALFNHGGGMRGLIPAHIMTRIEDMTGLRMVDMVDIFTGPSTGAILNAGLNVPHPREPSRPRFRARHMVRFYEREGAKIFPADRFREFRAFIHDFNNRTMKIGQLDRLLRHGHYSPAHLSRSLKAMYGDYRLCDSLRSLVIPVYNIEGEKLRLVEEAGETPDTPVHTKNNFRDDGGHALWLKNIKNLQDSGCNADVSLHDAVLASTAAPSYFPCHHFTALQDGRARAYSGIDGSIFDNPCISYHGAVRHHISSNEKLSMIVLGTGFTLRSFKKEDWNKFGGLGVVDPVNDLPLINILFHASESALLESFGQELGDNLYVFNKTLVGDRSEDLPNTQIDDASPENFTRLRRFAEEILEEHKVSFEQMCHMLVSNRDARQSEAKSGLLSRVKYFLTRG